MSEEHDAWEPALDELQEIRQVSAHVVRQTPISSLATVQRRSGGKILLKLENLQRTGSFKLRGAMSRLLLADDARGVVAGSAGNHGQAIAYAARMIGLRCVIYMPPDAPVSKVEAVAAFGAEVRYGSESVDDCVESAKQVAAEEGLLFAHPFNDLAVIKGQAGLGLEVMDQVPDVAQIIVPVGGGGLITGTAAALVAGGVAARVVGVQATGCAPFVASLAGPGFDWIDEPSKIADGIAIKRPGGITMSLAKRWVDEMVTVDDAAIAEAMVLLAERGKLVVEGAGAVSVAALISGAVAPSNKGVTVAVLSGGNVDTQVFAGLMNRHQTGIGRRSRLFTRVTDRPGGLAALLQIVAEGGGNVLDLTHVRDGAPLGLDQAGIELVMETRDSMHRGRLLSRLSAAGYVVEAFD